MFGYITTNGETLTQEEKNRYQALYCGLCKQLGSEYGGVGRATLTYDMTFLLMFLSSLYNMEETQNVLRCPINPIRQCPYVMTEATAYTADINLILAYYKTEDDWKDDHSLSAYGKKQLLAPKAEQAKKRWPRQSAAVEACLRQLSEMEAANELNPDLPTNCFGTLMGELFVLNEDDANAEKLRQMGAALGRFVYLMDACMDLHADIKKQRYNPLVAQTDMDFAPVLSMLIGECTETFESFPLEKDVSIMRNILYSGVWVKFKSKKEGKIKRDD